MKLVADRPFRVGDERANSVDHASHARQERLAVQVNRPLLFAQAEEILRSGRRGKDLDSELVSLVDGLLERGRGEDEVADERFKLRGCGRQRDR